MKYFFKQYWRYIAMALAFATFNFLLNACEVHAEGNYISPAQLTFKNYPSNHVYSATSCPNDTCYWEFDDRSRGGVWRNYNTTHNFTGVTLVLVNGSLVSDEGNNSILSINFLGNPCYYTQSVEFSSDSYSNHTQNHSFSAYCPISNTDNIGTLTITPNQELVEINMNNGVYVDKYQLSKIKIVQDTWGNEILRVLYQNNGYWATNEGLLTQVKGILEQNLSKIDIINGYLNTIQGYLQQQKDQAHQDAQQQIQATEDINDSINNSNTDGGQTQANDFFNNFDGGQTGSLMDLVSLPLEFLDSLNNTCSPISITIPFINQTFQLPCLRSTLTSVFGGLVSIIVLVINAILCYRLIKGFIDIFHDLKDPNNDEIEVMDL